MSVFDRDTQYVEICVGDLGPGIQRKLENLIPPDYNPPFRSKRPLHKAEQALAYAFEFSSTTNPERRAAKLRELLEDESRNPNEIATGLYCFLRIAKSHLGQFIIRTPKAILSFDFYQGQHEPIVKTKRELGIPSLGPLPGTHYLIRLPFNGPSTSSARAVPKRGEISSIPIQAINAFHSAKDAQPPEETLHSAIAAVDKALFKTRHKEGVTIIMPSWISLPSRADGLFVAAIRAMNHGKQRVIWLNHRAKGMVKNQIKGSSDAIHGTHDQAILVGDLRKNDFAFIGENDTRWVKLVEEEKENQGESQIIPRVYNAIRETYQKEIVATLQSIITRPSIRHTNESFLIEGQYYTETFFEIPRAWDNPFDVQLFAEWAFEELNPETEVLIGQSATVAPLIYALANLIKLYIGIEPKIVIHDLDSPPAKTISRLLTFSERRAILITDVICTGARLSDLLSLVTGVEIEKALTIVDGRSADRSGQPITWKRSGESKLLDVRSIHSEVMSVHDQPSYTHRIDNPEIGAAEEERVYVIDRITRAPTLYVRPAKPTMSLKEVLMGPTRLANALYCGHGEYEGKHYSYFLHLPKLFASLSRPIENWVRDQVKWVEDTGTAKEEPWYAFIYNPDGSLTWMNRFLASIKQRPNVRMVDRDQLRAPLPPRVGDPTGHYLILIPALASGETVRLCIEYISRLGPVTILVLCVASRMDPYHLTFLTNMRKYRDAQIRMAFFMEFSITSFAERDKICPMCVELNRLEQFREIVIAETGKKSILAEALKEKISTGQAAPLGTSEESGIRTSPSDHDFDRALIRALYESAAVNIPARRELNALLTENPQYIDRFLEVLASERFNSQFSYSELSQRLFKVEPLLYEHAAEIVISKRPPFQVGRVMGAIIHLAPDVLVGHAINLIERFSNSRRDVEDICIALLLVGAEPADAGDFYDSIFYKVDRDVQELVKDTLRVLKRSKDEDRSKYYRSIAAVGKLWATLTRSTQFFEPLRKLIQTSLEDYRSWLDVKSTVDMVWSEWRGEASELVMEIETSPLWARLSRRKPALGRSLAILDRAIAHLARLGKTAPNSRDNEVLLFQHIQATADEAVEASKEAAGYLYSFYISPTSCSALQLLTELPTYDNSVLKVEKHIDYYVPTIFCDIQDLDFMSGQLIDNWRKHKKQDRPGGNASFHLYLEKDEVIFEFWDDIEGSFNLQSTGGLGQVRECCEAYGGILSHITEGDRKALRIAFKSVELMPSLTDIATSGRPS